MTLSLQINEHLVLSPLYLRPSTEFAGYIGLLKTEVVLCMERVLDCIVLPPIRQ